MRPIYLIGYMGCGKTTLGRSLAARCDIRFVDLDDYIEEQAGRSIREIFAEEGEARFRELERDALMRLGGMDDTVIACGGGTPCFGDNMDRMNEMGTTVHLVTTHGRLLERLKCGRGKRPLIATLDDEELSEFIKTQLEKRRPHYGRASHEFDSTYLEDEAQIDETCEAFISRFNLPKKR